MSSAKFAEEFNLLIRAKYPIIYVVTVEEERAEATIEQTIKVNNSLREVIYYDLVHGFAHNNEAKNNLLQALQVVEQAPTNLHLVYIFRDLHRRLGKQRTDEMIVRQLRNLFRHLRSSRKTLVLISPILEIPPELEDQIAVLNFPLPDAEDIKTAIHKMVPLHQLKLSPTGLDQLVIACMGLTLDRIKNVLARPLAQKQYISETDLDLVLKEKQQRIQQTEYLEFFAPDETLDRIGGLDNLKEWLMQRRRAFSEEARAYGLPNPKGVLLMGIQGTGKSLCAKAIAHLWRLPLLRLDVGRLFGSLVGQSESRTRQTIQLTEALAPCILWMDEIDKAFAGMGGTSTDSGTSQRVFGTLLTWMQEKSSPVFVVATANNINALPPELLRKGRFDEIFFINLPSQAEREQIFMVHLQRFRPATLRDFDVEHLAQLAAEFSGAEIEQAIIEGMYRAFNENRDVVTADIEGAIKDTVPLASTAREQINYMKNWAAQGRARIASSGDQNQIS
ncbi:AAA ATPase central domain protein [Thalassoporum mexicanum PCC 7367]|uniref:AAA family ATPase n=1 Tax=Thalassoporum mexicanum TaxID=3457544 RepID=UPI00029FA3DE|nr:AAA family ATPase [Pseudanabaena sp. PCC 7367]AFY69229.1 AAA ATPase central domain protein [Pseudanabaena sp. PCC 7367]